MSSPRARLRLPASSGVHVLRLGLDTGSGGEWRPAPVRQAQDTLYALLEKFEKIIVDV